MSDLSRQTLRKTIRQLRLSLEREKQIHAGKTLVQQCALLPEIQHAQHIALYLAADGELDTAPLINWLWQQDKSVYLPVLHPFSPGHLLFLHYDKQKSLVPNQYGILEPKLDITDLKPLKELDIIFTPLVAFDNNGQRLGMGGGYYDRTLSGWFNSGEGAKPIGLAYDCQQVEQLPSEAWDIPLPKIVTPSKIWRWEK